MYKEILGLLRAIVTFVRSSAKEYVYHRMWKVKMLLAKS